MGHQPDSLLCHGWFLNTSDVMQCCCTYNAHFGPQLTKHINTAPQCCNEHCLVQSIWHSPHPPHPRCRTLPELWPVAGAAGAAACAPSPSAGRRRPAAAQPVERQLAGRCSKAAPMSLP